MQAELSSCSGSSRHALAVATRARQRQQQQQQPQQWQQLLEQHASYQQQQQLYGGTSAAELQLQGAGAMLLGEPSTAASLGGCSMVAQGNR
jgi:hypothetical protein